MGLARVEGKRANLTDRLGELARELLPAKPPWWVERPSFRTGTPAQGWYWIPAGQSHPLLLGHNHISAEMQLLQLLEGQEKPR